MLQTGAQFILHLFADRGLLGTHSDDNEKRPMLGTNEPSKSRVSSKRYHSDVTYERFMWTATLLFVKQLVRCSNRENIKALNYFAAPLWGKYTESLWWRKRFHHTAVNYAFKIKVTIYYQTIWLTLIPAWISNEIYHKIWKSITYPFPYFDGWTVEACDWMNNFIAHFIWHITGGHRTRVAAVTLDNMAETRSPLRKIYRKFSPCLFVTAAQLLCVDCQCYGTHWRGIPSCSDSVSRRNSGLKFRVVTRVSVVSVSPGTRVSVSLDEGTTVYKWT